jgi:hypothetical protein
LRASGRLPNSMATFINLFVVLLQFTNQRPDP